MTRRMLHRALAGCAVAACLVPGAAWAQTTEVAGHDFSSCSIVGVTTGVSTDSEAGASVGGVVGWPLPARLGLEIEAAWSDRPHDGSAFAAALALRRNLTSRRSVVPYVKAGVGAYVARFNTALATPPDFYRNRLRTRASLDDSRQAFTDPALVLAGGVSWFVGRRIAVRPEFQTMVVFDGSRRSTVMSVAARVEYHFEQYRITRDRRDR